MTIGAVQTVSTIARERLDLGEVEAALARELSGPTEGLLAAAERHLCLTVGAKRARPQLVLLLGQVAGASHEALLDAAVAVELIHSASLLHDDVVDEGELRRGVPTVNARHGNVVAVLAGDHLLSRALVLLAPHTQALSTRAAEVVAEMARAAVREVEVRGDATLSTAGYREIAMGKTAALFGLCGFAAGILAGDPARARRFETASRSLGMAFQMQDDLGDLVDQNQDRYGDIKERNPSLPVLFACEADARLRARFSEVWQSPPVPHDAARELGEAVLRTRAVDFTLEAIKRDVAEARRALQLDAGHPSVELIWQFADSLLADPRRARPA
jgi:geranylgeranyl pyrophosphate synthase